MSINVPKPKPIKNPVKPGKGKAKPFPVGERKERKPVMPLLPGEALGTGAKIRKDIMDLSNQDKIYKTY